MVQQLVRKTCDRRIFSQRFQPYTTLSLLVATQAIHKPVWKWCRPGSGYMFHHIEDMKQMDISADIQTLWLWPWRELWKLLAWDSGTPASHVHSSADIGRRNAHCAFKNLPRLWPQPWRQHSKNMHDWALMMHQLINVMLNGLKDTKWYFFEALTLYCDLDFEDLYHSKLFAWPSLSWRETSDVNHTQITDLQNTHTKN